MYSINCRRRMRSDDDLLVVDSIHPRFSHATWVAIAVGGGAVLGAGVSLIGMNKQGQANSAANQANQSAQNQQNQSAWSSYLMTRGIAPTGPVTPGVIPAAGNFQAVNTRLPLWATVSQTTVPIGNQAARGPIGGAAPGGAPVPFLLKKG